MTQAHATAQHEDAPSTRRGARARGCRPWPAGFGPLGLGEAPEDRKWLWGCSVRVPSTAMMPVPRTTPGLRDAFRGSTPERCVKRKFPTVEGGHVSPAPERPGREGCSSLAFHLLKSPTSLLSQWVAGAQALCQVICDSTTGADQEPGEQLVSGRGYLFIPSNHQKPKFTETGSIQ